MSRIDELLKEFHDIASNPKMVLDSYINAEKKVVACAPVYTPEELVHAMGMVPMGVWGADLELMDAKRYFPAFICSVMQSILEVGMNGGYEGISAIMIPSLCDSMKCLGENWKHAVPQIPFIAADYPQNRKLRAGFEYVRSVYKRQIKQLEEITGLKFSMEALEKTNRIYNEHNQIMRKVSAVLALHPSITAVQRSDIFKSALFLRKEEHTKLVQEFLQLLNERIETENKLPVMVTGIQADQPELLKIFDENNLYIAADDLAQESRQYQTDAPELENPLDALSQKFCDKDYCSILSDVDKKRIPRLIRTAQEQNVKGIIYVQTKFCDPEEFDYVAMKHACEKAAIPLLMIETDRQMAQFEQAKTAICAFTEMF